MSQRRTNTHEVIQRTLFVYKRARSAVWQCRYQINHKWFTETTREYLLEDAKRVAHMILMDAAIKQRYNVAPISHLFKDVAKLTIKRMEEELRLKEGRVIYKDYIFVIKRYLLPVLGVKPINQLSFKDMEELATKRIENMGHEPTKSTLKTHNAALSKVLTEAVMRGYMTEAQKPVLLTVGRSTERRPEFSLAEIKTLLKGFDGWISLATEEQIEIRLLLKDYVEALLDTGARPGRELLELRWANLKYAEDKTKLIINFNLSKTGKRTAVGRTMAIMALERIAHRNYAHSLDSLILSQNAEHIFRHKSKYQKLIRPVNFEKQMAFYLDHLKMLKCPITGNKRTFYSIRHTYATFALTYDKINIHTLARQMGTSVVMIEKHYSHLDAEKAIEQLGGEKTRGLLAS
jgi:integrase